MTKASPSALELSKLLFDNMHKVSVIEWEIYISIQEDENGFIFEDELKLDILKMYLPKQTAIKVMVTIIV